MVAPKETKNPSGTEHRIATALGMREAAERDRAKAEAGLAACQAELKRVRALFEETDERLVSIARVVMPHAFNPRMGPVTARGQMAAREMARDVLAVLKEEL